jgi:elongation factor Tu
MAKENSSATSPTAMIGHVDQGKTTLTAALSKVSADNGWGTFVSYQVAASAQTLAQPGWR